jgi:hypothetical protein
MPPKIVRKKATAAPANPFALDGQNVKGDPKQYTEEEAKTALQNYVEIGPNLWKTMKKMQHIRYRLKDGTLKPGGFVEAPALEKAKDGKTVTYLWLKSGFGPQGFKWTVPYDTISNIYVKLSTGEQKIYEDMDKIVASMNTQLAKLATKVKALSTELEQVKVATGASGFRKQPG